MLYCVISWIGLYGVTTILSDLSLRLNLFMMYGNLDFLSGLVVSWKEKLKFELSTNLLKEE